MGDMSETMKTISTVAGEQSKFSQEHGDHTCIPG